MAKKRITRKELVKKPDEFFTLTGAAIQWARENTKPLAYGIGAFFVFLVLVAGYRFYTENRERSAAALLSQSMTAYEAAINAEQTPAEALAVVQSDLDRLLDRYAGYDAGRLGRVFYGHISLSGNMPEQAIALYAKAIDQFEGSSSLGNTVLNGLAMAYLQKGDQAAATDVLEKLVNSSSGVLKDAALFHLGQLYQSAGDGQKSRNVYERLGTDFPDSIYANIAREKVAGLAKSSG